MNKNITEKYTPIVLINESSAYFNKVLFPYVNAFERKLRKLLYIKVALNVNDERAKKIDNLENMDLGEIFNIVFSDTKFVNQVKTQINKEMTWNFSKLEVIKAIENIDENTLWNHLMRDEKQTEIPQKFIEIKKYRNDVMHAHNIDYDTFCNAKELFININSQIDKEIEHNKPDKEFEILFDNALQDALQTQLQDEEILSGINIPNNILIASILENQKNIGSALSANTGIASILKNQPNIGSLLSANTGIASVLKNQPDIGSALSANTGIAGILKNQPNIGNVLSANVSTASILKKQPIIESALSANTGVAGILKNQGKIGNILSEKLNISKSSTERIKGIVKKHFNEDE